VQNKNILFEEKQYLGHNRLSIVIRTALAIFCLFSYYLSENSHSLYINIIIQNNSNSGFIFFILGNCILILSAALTFVLHIETKVYENYILLEGFWTSRKIKIDLNTITSIKKTKLKRTILRRAVYNLHNMGVIKFYTSGQDFIELTDDADFTYKIGSQKAQELYNILKQIIKIKN
jgi:hypothetical protein